MSRLLTCGFETGDVNESGTSTIGTNMALSAVNSTPTPRAGAYCLKIANTSGATLNASHKRFLLAAAQTEIWVRWAMYIHNVAILLEMGIAQIVDSAGNVQSSLSWDPTGNVLRLRVSASATSGTIIGTSGTAFPTDGWHVLEWRWKVITATTGNAELWLDGNKVIDFSGDVAFTAVLNAQMVTLGLTTNLAGGTGSYLAYDDIAVNNISGSFNNGRPGDGRVALLLPNGAGSSTQLARGGADTGANWSQVSEQPASMAEYVSSATVGQRDLYTMSNLGVAVSSINTVEAVSLTQNSDVGAGSIAHTLKSGATTSEGTAIGLATTAGFVRTQWETDPNTSAAWTSTAIDALEAGATIR